MNRSLRLSIVTLVIGASGGLIAYMLSLPLPWLIGAMMATSAVALLGFKIVIWNALRTAMITVLGVFLGSSFSSSIAENLLTWGTSLVALLAVIAISGAATFWYYRRVVGYDLSTSYFSAMPGGLTEMTLVGAIYDGDVRIISISHTTRILLVVLVIPFALQIFLNYDPQNRPPIGVPLMNLAPQDLLILALCATVGFLGGRVVKMPAGDIVGPMLISAVAHLSGLTTAKPPLELVTAAQVVIGAAIGCRFAGANMTMIRVAAISAIGATFILVGVPVAIGELVHLISGFPVESLVLSYIPGGVAEMSLVAVALATDASFVATHHLLRIFMVVVAAPFIFRLLQGWLKRRTSANGSNDRN